MAVKWDKFFPYITPAVSSCPTSLVEHTLVERTREFCRRTQVWRVDFDAETTEAGEHTYPLYLSGDLESVLWIRLDDAEIDHVDDRAVDSQDFTDTGRPIAYSMEAGNAIRFYPIPDAAYTFVGRAVLVPSETAFGVEDHIFNAHARTLASGVLAYLLAMPDKAWTNLPLAAVHEQQFERGIVKARVRDFRNVPLRVKPQFF